jgi:hypothetical protein
VSIPVETQDSQRRVIAMDVSPAALVNASTQIQEGQVAQAAQLLVLKKSMDIQASGTLALLQALPLATSGNLGTQVNVMA